MALITCQNLSLGCDGREIVHDIGIFPLLADRQSYGRRRRTSRHPRRPRIPRSRLFPKHPPSQKTV